MSLYAGHNDMFSSLGILPVLYPYHVEYHENIYSIAYS